MANKFNARKTQCSAGHKHDSKREATRCGELRMLERAGAITDLGHQPQFYFKIDGRDLIHDNGRRVGVRLDFIYTEKGQRVAEDSKGKAARDWPLRKAVFRACFPQIELREV